MIWVMRPVCDDGGVRYEQLAADGAIYPRSRLAAQFARSHCQSPSCSASYLWSLLCASVQGKVFHSVLRLVLDNILAPLMPSFPNIQTLTFNVNVSYCTSILQVIKYHRATANTSILLITSSCPPMFYNMNLNAVYPNGPHTNSPFRHLRRHSKCETHFAVGQHLTGEWTATHYELSLASWTPRAHWNTWTPYPSCTSDIVPGIYGHHHLRWRPL